MQLLQVKLKDIRIGENLSRAGVEHTTASITALAEAILVNNYWNPPDVIRRGHRKDSYELVAGHLRIQAAKLLSSEARLPQVAGDKNGVWVLLHSKSEAERDLQNAAENIVRKNLSTYQTAHTLLELHERYGHDYKKLVEISGRTLTNKAIANYVRAARELCTPIQRAWLNFEGSDHPIPINKLLAWAALPLEDQEREFAASRWNLVYKMLDNKDLRPKSMRRRSEIEKRLANAFGIEKVTLEWVLCLTEKDNERRTKDGSNRPGDDSKGGRGVNVRHDSSGPGPRSSGRPRHGDDSSLRPRQAGQSNGSPEHASGVTWSGSPADSSGLTVDDE